MTTSDDGAATSAADLAAAAAGDQGAWDRLVDRHAQWVWSTARGFGLGAVAAAQVCGVAWARLADHLDEVRTDEQLRRWLGTIASHEARRVVCARRV